MMGKLRLRKFKYLVQGHRAGLFMQESFQSLCCNPPPVLHEHGSHFGELIRNADPWAPTHPDAAGSLKAGLGDLLFTGSPLDCMLTRRDQIHTCPILAVRLWSSKLTLLSLRYQICQQE